MQQPISLYTSTHSLGNIQTDRQTDRQKDFQAAKTYAYVRNFKESRANSPPKKKKSPDSEPPTPTPTPIHYTYKPSNPSLSEKPTLYKITMEILFIQPTRMQKGKTPYQPRARRLNLFSNSRRISISISVLIFIFIFIKSKSKSGSLLMV